MELFDQSSNFLHDASIYYERRKLTSLTDLINFLNVNLVNHRLQAARSQKWRVNAWTTFVKNLKVRSKKFRKNDLNNTHLQGASYKCTSTNDNNQHR